MVQSVKRSETHLGGSEDLLWAVWTTTGRVTPQHSGGEGHGRDSAQSRGLGETQGPGVKLYLDTEEGRNPSPDVSCFHLF